MLWVQLVAVAAITSSDVDEPDYKKGFAQVKTRSELDVQMSMHPIQVAQIGVGYWGPNLLRNFVSCPAFTVKAVIDKSEDRRKFVEALYPSIELHSNIDRAIDDPEIDAVVISTPVATHYELAIKAIQAGKHVLVEKPMAATVDEVEHIAREADAKKVIAMVGHTFLFNQAVRYVKGLIDNGDLGDIRYIYSQRLNLGRIRNDVDALWNLAPHDISIIQYWLNDVDPEGVSRKGVDYIQDGIDDVVFLSVNYPDKVMAHVHVSWLDPHKVRKITVVGSRKMVVYDDMAENKVAIFDKGIDPLAVLGQNMDYDNPGSLEFNHRSGDVIMPRVPWREPLKVEVEHFADCIQGKAECLTGPAHASRVVRILSQVQ